MLLMQHMKHSINCFVFNQQFGHRQISEQQKPSPIITHLKIIIGQMVVPGT
jgi:hypothetical protein